jgi:uncharacterized RDD family membrane protein YckC
VVGRRIVAFIIDSLIATAISFALVAGLRSNTYSGAPTHACDLLRQERGFSGTCLQLGSHVYTWSGGRFFWLYAFWIGVSFLNYVLLQGLTGATVGKFVVGIRVIDHQGDLAGVGRSFLRWLLLVVDYVVCFLIGLISVLVTRPHRRVGDMVASTDVVATPDVGSPAAVPTAYGGWTPAPAPGGPYEQPAASPWGTPAPPTWGTPPPAPPAAQQAGSPWGTPAPVAPPAWGSPSPATPPAPSDPPPATPEPSGEDQPGWASPEPQQPPPPPAAPRGASWWDRADAEEDEPKQ